VLSGTYDLFLRFLYFYFGGAVDVGRFGFALCYPSR
jgi:hypothetical protein